MMTLLGDGLRSAETHTLSHERVLYPSHRPGGGVASDISPPPPLFVLVILGLLSPVFARLHIYAECYEQCYKNQNVPLAGRFMRHFIHVIE